MPSKWYCFTDDEHGPYTFHELAGMLAREQLLPADLVRRSESQDWQRADAVLGLQREANRIKDRGASRASRAGTGFGQWMIRKSEKYVSQIPGECLVAGVAVLAMVCLLGQLAWLWASRPPQFPKAPVAGVVMDGPSRLTQLAPNPPARPTLPDLPVRTPRIVPGFERLYWLKSPTLSDDLLTIVYVGYVGEKLLDDLVIAERRTVAEPFSNHQFLSLVNSELREAHPALSPDGLELAFCRLGAPSTVWISRRSDRTSSFGKPKALKLSPAPAADQHLDAPQFIDSKTIRVTIGDQSFQNRRQHMATREGEAGFRLGSALATMNPWPRYFLTSKGRRAFLPAEDGLRVTAFSSRVRQFEEPELLFGTDVVGTGLASADDTIWVAPREDVIFYCGPGREPDDPASRRLWMIRLGR